MILTRFVRGQLVAFAAMSLAGILVLGIVFLRVPAAVGIDVRTVHAVFPDAARLYERAAVTYRGDPVGIVTRIHLVEGGIKVDLRIDDDVDIPTSVSAHVRSMSAVGEQYVDLVAGTGDPPYLSGDDTIPISQTTVPPQIGPILDQTNKLLAALPQQDLDTVVDEAYAALNGTAPDLDRLIDSGTRLVDKAEATYAATSTLLEDLQPALGAVRASSPQIRSLTNDLAAVTDQLRASDKDLRGLLHDGQNFATETTGLLNDVAPTLPTLMHNLFEVGKVARTYNDSLETIAVVYPALTAAAQSITAPTDKQNSINLDLAVQQNDPPPCATGFIPAEKWRPPSDTSTAPTPPAYCKLPHDSPTAVRGARNLPCQAVPGHRAATPAQCRGEGYNPETGDNPPFPDDSLAGSSLSSPRPPLPLPSLTDGKSSPVTSGKELSWQKLLLAPLTR